MHQPLTSQKQNGQPHLSACAREDKMAELHKKYYKDLFGTKTRREDFDYNESSLRLFNEEKERKKRLEEKTNKIMRSMTPQVIRKPWKEVVKSVQKMKKEDEDRMKKLESVRLNFEKENFERCVAPRILLLKKSGSSHQLHKIVVQRVNILWDD